MVDEISFPVPLEFLEVQAECLSSARHFKVSPLASDVAITGYRFFRTFTKSVFFYSTFYRCSFLSHISLQLATSNDQRVWQFGHSLPQRKIRFRPHLSESMRQKRPRMCSRRPNVVKSTFKVSVIFDDSGSGPLRASSSQGSAILVSRSSRVRRQR